MSSFGSYSYAKALVTQLRNEVESFERQTARTEHDLLVALRTSQRRQFELANLVVALIETLAASGTLDLDVLDGRLENLRSAQPWSAENPEPLTADKPYQCVVCFRAMPIADGTLADDGMHCSVCMSGRS